LTVEGEGTSLLAGVFEKGKREFHGGPKRFQNPEEKRKDLDAPYNWRSFWNHNPMEDLVDSGHEAFRAAKNDLPPYVLSRLGFQYEL